ncbi:SMC-Scp complex subunit ScpB [Planctomonas psychrotolerans]|uniref:SMC-Scp complex subunit ScpB n=1 Tax=Planctomonas psychrotolerans TaxID=2528712 RepID=UPI0012394C88|nr:SMC-Scp complex subunit ScpB [Planctomonas psychrotolerans]
MTTDTDTNASAAGTPAPAESATSVTDARPPHAAAHLDVDRALEAVLMVADEPQSLVHLATAVDRPVSVVRQAIERLVADYDGVAPYGGGAGAGDGAGAGVGDAAGDAVAPGSTTASAPASGRRVRRGFELREVGGGWRIYVRGEYDDVVRDYVLTQNPTKLSQAALETLAVIAYKQPISRGAVAAIRAVNVDSVVRTLLARGLISEVYTDSETGAIHYGTSDLLLSQLGINSIDELPPISPLLADGAEGFHDGP